MSSIGLRRPDSNDALVAATALTNAAFAGDIALIKTHLAKGSADVNTSDSGGYGPLHRAAIGGSAEAVQALISSGAHVNARDSAGDTALHYAAHCGHLPVVSALLQANADATAVSNDGRTPLTAALDEGHTAVAAALISHLEKHHPASDWPGRSRLNGGNSDAQSGIGGGAGGLSYAAAVAQLGDAAFAGDLRSVFTLISSTGGGATSAADVNGADPDGFTALHRAAAGGSVPVLELLLGHGGDPNTRDLAGCTPLHYASFAGHTDAVHCLLGAGADPSRRNRDGCTALDLAHAESRKGVERLLSGTFTKVEDVDFSYGVALEGRLEARAGDGSSGGGSSSGSSGGGGGLSSLLGISSWRQKYTVLSRRHRALFLWTGGPTSVEGAVTRIKLASIAAVAVTGGNGSKKFVVRPVPGAGHPVELKAASPQDAAIWAATIKATIVATQEDDSRQSLYRTLLMDAQALAAAQQQVAAAVAAQQRAEQASKEAAAAAASAVPVPPVPVPVPPHSALPPLHAGPTSLSSHPPATVAPLPTILASPRGSVASATSDGHPPLPAPVPVPLTSVPSASRDRLLSVASTGSHASSIGGGGPPPPPPVLPSAAAPARSSLGRGASGGGPPPFPPGRLPPPPAIPRPITPSAPRPPPPPPSPGLLSSSFSSSDPTSRAAVTVQRATRGWLARRYVRGWVRVVDPNDGDVYWYHSGAGASSWFPPGVDPDLPAYPKPMPVAAADE